MVHTLPRIHSMSFQGKVVLVRVGFDVPLRKGKITDTSRIDEALPTIRHILLDGGTVILLTHLGRPGGEFIKEFSLDPIRTYLEEQLKKSVRYVRGFDFEEIRREITDIKKKGEILLLENLRFHKGEEENDLEFANELASLGDIYVNEAFSVAHRRHASIVGIPAYMNQKAAGMYFASEVDSIKNIFEKAEHPMTLVLGGAKVDTKAPLINAFLGKCDYFLLGGALANTFLAAEGYEVGLSKYEENMKELAQDTIMSIVSHREKVIIPEDVVVVDELVEGAISSHIPIMEVQPDDIIADIGTKTASQFIEIISRSKTVIWNGPLGFTEVPEFAASTLRVAKALAAKKNATTLIGGGDTGEALRELGVDLKSFTHVSTSGGALIEFIEKGTLPGIDALFSKN